MTSDKRENKITLSHILPIKADCKRRINYDTLIFGHDLGGGDAFQIQTQRQTIRTTGVAASPGERH